MKKVTITIQAEVTDEHFEKHLKAQQKSIESGEFQKEMLTYEGVESFEAKFEVE